jgi:hypothetical protein
MFHCGKFSSARGCALAALLALAPGASAAAEELRSVLATGDDVPRLGRIGVWGLHLVGLDDRGRALVSRVDNEHEESVWADGERFVPLIDPAEADGVELFGQTLSLHPAGPVVGYGFRRGGPKAYDALYAVVDGRVTEVARVGERDAAGNTICEIHNYSAINARGAVALAATVTPSGYQCGDPNADEPTAPYYEAVYVADGGLTRVGGSGPLSPAGWDLAAFTLWSLNDAGEAIVQGFGADASLEGGAPSPPGGGAGQTGAATYTTTGQMVLALRADGARLLYRTSDADGPTEIGVGEDPPWFQVFAVSRAGEVAFRRRAAGGMGLYRTDAGRVRRLIAAGDPAPWGGEYAEGDAYAWPAAFNQRGDLLMSQSERSRLVLYPADGPARVFPERASSGALNERGDVAVLQQTSDEALAVVRYRNGNARRLAATGDRLPGGGVLAAHGLGASCMAPNGAVAAAAQVTGGATALVCGETRGFRPVSRMGDPRPDGRRFYSFDACAFAGPDALVFIGSSLVPSGGPRDYHLQSAVYRALAQRLERVLGPGDALADGAVITHLPVTWSSLLDADASAACSPSPAPAMAMRWSSPARTGRWRACRCACAPPAAATASSSTPTARSITSTFPASASSLAAPPRREGAAPCAARRPMRRTTIRPRCGRPTPASPPPAALSSSVGRACPTRTRGRASARFSSTSATIPYGASPPPARADFPPLPSMHPARRWTRCG